MGSPGLVQKESCSGVGSQQNVVNCEKGLSEKNQIVTTRKVLGVWGHGQRKGVCECDDCRGFSGFPGERCQLSQMKRLGGRAESLRGGRNLALCWCAGSAGQEVGKPGLRCEGEAVSGKRHWGVIHGGER